MSDENKKEIKVKMRVVAFSDLPKMKEIAYKELGVGNIRRKQKENKEKDNKISTSEIDLEQLEREGNESIF